MVFTPTATFQSGILTLSLCCTTHSAPPTYCSMPVLSWYRKTFERLYFTLLLSSSKDSRMYNYPQQFSLSPSNSAKLGLVPVIGLEPIRITSSVPRTDVSTIPPHWHKIVDFLPSQRDNPHNTRTFSLGGSADCYNSITTPYHFVVVPGNAISCYCEQLSIPTSLAKTAAIQRTNYLNVQHILIAHPCSGCLAFQLLLPNL